MVMMMMMTKWKHCHESSRMTRLAIFERARHSHDPQTSHLHSDDDDDDDDDELDRDNVEDDEDIHNEEDSYDPCSHAALLFDNLW